MQHEPDVEKNSKTRQGCFCRCGLQCSTTASLQTHITSFNCPRNYTCQICDAKFVAWNFLRAHMESKHKVKVVNRKTTNRIACGDCGEYFFTRPEHRRHREAFHEQVELVEGESKRDNPCHMVDSYDPPTCKCGIIYRNKRALTTHMRSILKPFKCHMCGKRFGHLSSLTFHLESTHNIAQRRQAFECGRCAHSFSTLDEILEHCRQAHGGENDEKASGTADLSKKGKINSKVIGACNKILHN